MTFDLNEGNRRLQEEALASPPAPVELDPATIERDAEFMVQNDPMMPLLVARIICHKRMMGGNTRTSNWTSENYKFEDQPIVYQFWETSKRKSPSGKRIDSYTFTDGSSYCDNKGIVRYQFAPGEDVSSFVNAGWEPRDNYFFKP